MTGTKRRNDDFYIVRNTPSLRRTGVKGEHAYLDIVGKTDPLVIVTGEKRGRIEFRVSDISRLRAGIEVGRLTQYRTIVWRTSGSTLALNGTTSPNYSDLIIQIAKEMDDLGRFSRVERGLRWWENLILLSVFGSIMLVLLYAPYDTYINYGADWGRNDILFAWGMALLTLIAAIYLGWSWLRWCRPRRARDIDDLAAILV